jgi:hypothetical protein
MPYKQNESRRHKIKKTGYKVTNWKEYNEALRNRGDITVWFTPEAIADWHPEKAGKRGRHCEPKQRARLAAPLRTSPFFISRKNTLMPNLRLQCQSQTMQRKQIVKA